MIWDLIQLVLLIAFVIVYTGSLYLDNVTIKDLEEIHLRDEELIQAYARLLEVHVKGREMMIQEAHEQMGDMLVLETERDHYIRRCVLLEDENAALKKLLELQGIECRKSKVEARPVLNWDEITGKGEKLCPTE